MSAKEKSRATLHSDIASIENFLITLKLTKGASAHTLDAYERDLAQFADYIKRTFELSLLKVEESHLQKFLRHLKSKKLSPSSMARKLSALKQYFRFQVKEGNLKEDPTTLIESPSPRPSLPKAIQSNSIAKLIEVLETGYPYERKFKEELKIRDQAMVILLYATGLRVSELVGLQTEHLDIEAGLLKVFGKRNKERMVPFVPFAGELLSQYLSSARPQLKPKTGHVFVGARGEPLTRQSFWRILKSLSKMAGIPEDLHPHMLRHTFASDLLKSGMNLRSLQMLLGHSDLQTTQIYTHVTPDHLAHTIERFHPLGDAKKKTKRKP